MKYVVFGAGAVGKSIAAFMTRAKKDVTVIARGETLKSIKKNGITVDIAEKETFNVMPNIVEQQDYLDTPDVIFVCVKGYSIDETVPFLLKISNKDTIIIPILNIFGTGEVLQKQIPNCLVTDGCVYIAAEAQSGCKIKMHGDIFRIVYGVRDSGDYTQKLEQIKNDIDDSEIIAILSDNIRRDAMMKFSYVSAQASCGLYYDVAAGAMQTEGEIRNCFISLVREIVLLSNKMGIVFDEDIESRNLKILDDLQPTSSTSMQRDIEKGSRSEIDGLLFAVLRNAENNSLQLPKYKEIAEFAKKKLNLDANYQSDIVWQK